MYLPRELCCIALVIFVFTCLVTGHNEGETEDSFSHQAKDIDHIKKHIKENLGMNEEAAEKYMKEMDGEVQFFLMNDLNKDSRIDGLEIYRILTHRHEHDESAKGGPKIPKLDEENIEKRIDEALHKQDQNDDGYIDYEEFLRYYRPDLHTKATGRETGVLTKLDYNYSFSLSLLYLYEKDKFANVPSPSSSDTLLWKVNQLNNQGALYLCEDFEKVFPCCYIEHLSSAFGNPAVRGRCKKHAL